MANPALKSEQAWFVYLIRTKSNALYCGITNDVAKRFATHQQGKGAKALRGKGPLQLVWQQPAADKSQAAKIEYYIKQFAKAKKECLVADQGVVTLQD
ncbi:GIY-YIG nuclease family protein [Vibrio tapetis]|uniref:GIY-YIG nuclease family protein n=1 Tax=Vibrio tapetis TaxID=52443 RepID=UPI000C82E704|nr:GIY-YIG nuclease family protein [Vibrio tapetis]